MPLAAHDASVHVESGFIIEARISSLNLPGAEGVFGGLGGPAAVGVGYRGEGFTVSFAPALHRVEVSETRCAFDPTLGGCSGGEDRTDSAWLLVLGAQALGTVSLATALEGRSELYLLGAVVLGAALLDEESQSADAKGDPLAFGATVALGVRYFVTSPLAVSAEIGEGYLNIPVDSSTTRSTRASAFATWGALGVSLGF